MNPVTQGLAVHPGQPRGACPIHPFQSVGDRDQPGADATIALPSRLSAQLLRTNVITDRQSRHCGSPLPRPQHLLLAKPCRCNFLGESASTQVGIRRYRPGPESKGAPDTFTRREGRFRRYKRLNYLRCCRAANRSATVAFATVPAAAAIAAAMFGSSSAAFASLNALAFMSRVAARSRVACAVCVIASTATLMPLPLPLPLLRPATARAVSARHAARCSSTAAWAMSFLARISLAFASLSAVAFA